MKDIFVANNWSKSTTNYGGRIAFDRDGFLYLTVGERQEQERAQKTDDHGGKVLRLRDDGSVPPDNPFVGKPGYLPEIYSLGHRSPQGLALNPETGALWENEHGPLGGDELNIILPGRNYGWPLVTFGTDYDGTKISDATSRADLESPFMYWVPSIAISADLLHRRPVPAVEGQRLRRLDVRRAARAAPATSSASRSTRRAADPARAAADRAAAAHSRRAAGPGRPALCAHRRRRRHGAAARAGCAAAAPNASGVAMGHLHYRVRDVDGEQEVLDGARRRRAECRLVGRDRASHPGRAILKFQDVLVFLDPGETTGGTEGSIVNHVAFRVPSLAPVEAAGLTVARLNAFPGVASINTPEGERIELFENAATNLTFTQDAGFDDAVAERHNRPLPVPIAFHHVHLYVPDGQLAAAKAWYVRMFGGVPGKRSNYEAVDLPGINLNFSAAPNRPCRPRGGCSITSDSRSRGLAAFCQQTRGRWVLSLMSPTRRAPSGLGSAR